MQKGYEKQKQQAVVVYLPLMRIRNVSYVTRRCDRTEKGGTPKAKQNYTVLLNFCVLFMATPIGHW